jgi:hypothetical protein
LKHIYQVVHENGKKRVIQRKPCVNPQS